MKIGWYFQQWKSSYCWTSTVICLLLRACFVYITVDLHSSVFKSPSRAEKYCIYLSRTRKFLCWMAGKLITSWLVTFYNTCIYQLIQIIFLLMSFLCIKSLNSLKFVHIHQTPYRASVKKIHLSWKLVWPWLDQLWRQMDFFKRTILPKNEKICCVRPGTEFCKIEFDG